MIRKKVNNRCYAPGGRFGIIILLTVFMCTIAIGEIEQYDFPTFRVVLDPGHGGVAKRPISMHGDRYDAISEGYLDIFKEGAALGRLRERDIVYSIVKKAERYLRLCAPNGDNNSFYEILKQYTDEEPERINILTLVSRKRNITEDEAETLRDPNGPYRLFDYPGEDGSIRDGRLSKMNAFRPHLIVSLHLAEYGPREYRGMSPVVAAPYSFLEMGLRYLKGDRGVKDEISRGVLEDWFCEGVDRSNFQWFLNDVSLYYTGYSLKKNSNEADMFRGYRYNMVDWRYRDFDGWEYIARGHPSNTRYARSVQDFVPDGKFWARERSRYEKYRREGGREGFGGDNAFASYEIIRYILYTLYRGSGRRIRYRAGKSYINVWIIPLQVNAINAYLELGYLRRPLDRHIMTERQDEIARGVAVGVYSLFAGLQLKKDDFSPMPKGKRIDLDRYRMSNDSTYFDAVVE